MWVLSWSKSRLCLTQKNSLDRRLGGPDSTLAGLGLIAEVVDHLAGPYRLGLGIGLDKVNLKFQKLNFKLTGNSSSNEGKEFHDVGL